MTPRARRIAAFFTIAALLQVSPLLAQVFRVRGVPFLMGWRMYERMGSEICDVRFAERSPDGTLRRIPFETAAGANRRIRREEDVHSVGASFCRKAAGRDIRMTARCGDWFHGWIEVADGSEPLCPYTAPAASATP